MVFFEYDAEAEKRVIYRDGVEEGRAKSGSIPKFV